METVVGIALIIISALGATLFLGGFSGPLLPGWLWLAIKIAAMLFLFIWLRATLPRLRYDRLMKLGWKVLLPLATLNLVVDHVATAAASNSARSPASRRSP